MCTSVNFDTFGNICTLQCTEEDDPDKKDLLEAVNIMADVAAFINESKRRKDIGKC